MKSKRQKRKKKYPVTTMDSRSSKAKDRKLISRLHVAVKELETCRQDASIPSAEKKMKIQQLQEQIEQLGGLDAYQTCSLLGEHHHGNINTSKWVLQKLKEHDVRAERGCKLRLLDVGALKLNYTKQEKWLDAEAIDLNPQCDGIIKSDFFDYKVGQSNIYDIIVLSLVLNFVGTPKLRGDMLKRCKSLCKPEGYLFVILPLACLENSRYLDEDLFQRMMKSLTFDLITQHSSKKLSFKMFRKLASPETSKAASTFPKHEVRNGKKCNNYNIVLR